VAENRFKTSTEKRPDAAAPMVPQAPPGVTAEPRDQGADQRADQRADEAADQASAQVAGRAPYRATDRNSDPGPGENPDRRPDPSTDPTRLRQNQGRWKLSFSLFLLGFMLLIVAANKNLPTGETWVFRGVAAVLCVGAFCLARQAQRHSKAQRPKA
jgi:hypothetical protein